MERVKHSLHLIILPTIAIAIVWFPTDKFYNTYHFSLLSLLVDTLSNQPLNNQAFSNRLDNKIMFNHST